ncbi:Hpt domain-containing protein [Methylobacter sp.]|uniref:Hpt domain-containing protein n=1 Tax=Methylobacter sp. TaxID=2051955 RepID=UPI002FDEAD7C
MPSKPKQPKQFIVLMTGNIDVNHSSLKHRRQNIIVATQHDDILMRIETTQFDLILIDSTVDCSDESVSSAATLPTSEIVFPSSMQSELIGQIKDPAGRNSKTPVIIINPIKDSWNNQQGPTAFDDSLTGPITEQQLNEIIDLWQTKALALDYIQIIQSKTKNNQRLTLTLFEKLFEELPLQVIDIKNALGNKQYDLAQEITHKLNGSVSFCGLMDIQQPANALESCLLFTNNYADAYQHFLTLQQCTLNFTRHQKFILANLGKC